MEDTGPRARTRARWPLFAGLAVVGLAVVAVFAFRSGESDLERLNGDVRALNEALTGAQAELDAYAAAEAEAANWRATYATESDADPTIMGIVDGHLGTAGQQVATARDNRAKAGAPRAEYAQYAEAEHQAVKAARQAAQDAARAARIGVEELRAVPALADDVLDTYVRTFIWFELDEWWNSETDEYSSGQACYYGEVVSTVNQDGTVDETIVDDGQASGWKAFTVADYDAFVGQGVVPAMADTNPSQEEVGRYLCGTSPQTGAFGALGEPEITLVKERGSVAPSQEDEGALVGDYRYGTWCAPVAAGTPQALPEPADDRVPENADWCWHMPAEGGDARYYYHGSFVNGLWAYSRGPRRCYDCDARSWTGGTLVPSGQMAQATGSDVPNVRAGAQDGGPGTGK